MFFSVMKCRMMRALGARAFSLLNSHHGANQTLQDLCKLTDWSSRAVARTHCGQCLSHRRTDKFCYFSGFSDRLFSLCKFGLKLLCSVSCLIFLRQSTKPCHKTKSKELIGGIDVTKASKMNILRPCNVLNTRPRLESTFLIGWKERRCLVSFHRFYNLI